MADKSFGVKELNLLNASGTPTVTSPNNLNLNANTVAISTSATVGNNLTVTSTTNSANLNVTGIGTLTRGFATDLSVSGISTISQPSNANPHSLWDVVNNGSSAYRFTGPGQSGDENNPNIYLVRGQRYIFKVNASGHPFQLRVANGGAAYSDGVTNNGAQSGNVVINVQHDAPAQLYYQCTSHGGMVGNIYIVGGPQVISGVVTATTFVGNLTGNVTGNATGLSGTPNISAGTIAGSTGTFTGDLTIPDKIVHAGDTDTAIRFSGADTIKLETGGSERLRVDSTGDTIVSGTLFADSDLFVVDQIRHTGDTNTAIRFPAADTVTVETGGSERVRVDSSGRIGVGVVPTAQFAHNLIQIGNQATLGANAALSATGQTFLTHNLYFDTGGTFRVFNTSNANEGAIFRLVDGNLLFSNSAATTGTPTVTERLRIDSNGDLGLGIAAVPQDSGARTLHIHDTDTGSGARAAIRLTHGSSGSSASNGAFIGFDNNPDFYIYNQESGNLRFGTAGSERMRILSGGNVCINTTTTVGLGGPRLSLAFDGSANWLVNSNDTAGQSGARHYVFHSNGTEVGKIETTTSATSYSTSSDYRLKENITAISDGITRLKTLKPSRFNFKVDKDTTVDGFLAHEVTAVPEAISGTKDEVVTQAMIDNGDAPSDSKLNDPIYQQIDQAKLVPLLTAALQEAITKIETLEAKVAALEGS